MAARRYARGQECRDVRPLRRLVLGFIINLRYPENAEAVAEARRCGAERDCTIMVADASEFVERADEFQRLLRERRVDGLMVGTLLPTTAAIAAMARQRRPLVLVNRRIPWLAPSVAGDDAGAVELAVRHLIGQGHRRIAYINGPGEADTVHRRLDGFRVAMDRAGLLVPHDYISSSSADPDTGPAEAMNRLLALSIRPTAVVLWTVGDALGVLHAVRSHDLSVPRDVSLVAINDSPSAAYLDPPLTVIRLPLAEAAGRAVARLCDAVNGHAMSCDVLIRTAPVLIQRASTAAPAVA